MSMVEAEVIALAYNCRESLPRIDIVTFVGDAVGLSKDLTIMHVIIHEDNAGDLILAETLPPQ